MQLYMYVCIYIECSCIVFVLNIKAKHVYSNILHITFLLDLQGLFSCLATESQPSAGVCPLVHAV